MPPWDNTSGKRPHTGTAAVGLNCLRRHPTEVGVGPARTLEIPLKSAAGAEADPAIVAALFERGDLMTPQLSQRLWVDAKNSRHIGGGHPSGVDVLCGHSISVFCEFQVGSSACPLSSSWPSCSSFPFSACCPAPPMTTCQHARPTERRGQWQAHLSLITQGRWGPDLRSFQDRTASDHAGRT